MNPLHIYLDPQNTSVYRKIFPTLPDDIINKIRIINSPCPWASIYDNLCIGKNCPVCIRTSAKPNNEHIGNPLFHLIALEREHRTEKISISRFFKEPEEKIFFSSQIVQIDLPNYKNETKISIIEIPRRSGGDAFCDFFFKVSNLKSVDQIDKIVLKIGYSSVEYRNFVIKQCDNYCLVGTKETSWPILLLALQFHKIFMEIHFNEKFIEYNLPCIIGCQLTYMYYDTDTIHVLINSEKGSSDYPTWRMGPDGNIVSMIGLGAFGPFPNYKPFNQLTEYIHTFYKPEVFR